MVGAHHDTVPGSPGADDNGSGLAALLEIARILGVGKWQATLELVAFDFEERGDPDSSSLFAGSRAYVAALSREVELRGAFVYDLIGYASHEPGSQKLPQGLELLFPAEAALLEKRQGRADFIAALVNAERGGELLRAFLAAAGASGLPTLPLTVQAGTPARDLYRSDHVPFWEAGLPTLFLSDTADFRNPHYHLPSDTPETLDPAFWARVVAATVGAVAALARPA